MSLSSRPSQGAKILLVDGDPNYVFLLKTHLQTQNYEVTTAENTLEAIAHIEASTPDLIITGAVLAEGRGHDVLAYLRQQKGDLSWIPLIFVSAKARRSDRIEGINAGATAYVTKPLSLEELNAQVESCLRNSQNIRLGQQKPSPTKLQVPTDIKLTNTEQQVAKLVAKGLSNLEISQQMFTSKRTVESHISHMLRKTELTNRTELSRWILENDLA
jgi:DNA-binding NarL/FixJ family response regulator